ncbi:hypothetical protein DERP_008894 [Dermatophagoides pteronyssinus]|uniref:Uncharacterized protein n=1 Tax=Dermatophagoides pteronyssinus TaxID=6956 RepID=A0ABQ8JP15_DERPT|nr:hypothetical protein DERP_008894 [Dermatophagoides pteronyssinus]
MADNSKKYTLMLRLKNKNKNKNRDLQIQNFDFAMNFEEQNDLNSTILHLEMYDDDNHNCRIYQLLSFCRFLIFRFDYLPHQLQWNLRKKPNNNLTITKKKHNNHINISSFKMSPDTLNRV